MFEALKFPGVCARIEKEDSSIGEFGELNPCTKMTSQIVSSKE
jgi:hypothetical protein